jgi:hypothetical protein
MPRPRRPNSTLSSIPLFTSIVSTSSYPLKILARDTNILVDGPEESVNTHDLSTLWTLVESLLCAAFTKEVISELGPVREMVAELARVDPRSDTFRYPVTKKGAPSIPGLSHINIAHFRERIAVVEQFLEGATAMVAHYLDLKAEVEAGHRAFTNCA